MTPILRPESDPGTADSDEVFLRRLISATVALELGAETWPEPTRSHLLDMQCTARRGARRADFPGAIGQIIQVDRDDAGWVVVAAMQDAVHLVEIMILPELRGRGIGSAVIGRIVLDAGAEGKPVRLSVNPLNLGAIRLYDRLGFRIVKRTDVEYIMETVSSASPMRHNTKSG
jgi:ribosomal protein S18 acetylase RimI-like enzyme